MAGLFWMVLLVTIFGTIVAESDLFMMSHRTPRYFQANITFARAKQYFRHNLPYGNLANITATNIGFGVLLGVTGKLVQAAIVNPRESDPQAMIEQYSLYARRNYKEVAQTMNEILEEASKKVAPILELINKICTPTSFFDCNGKMDARVLSDSFTFRMPAKLFIHLGKLSKNIMRNQILIEKLVNNNEVVLYLTQHIRDPSIDKLIKKMARTYIIMKTMDTIYM